jgi:putative transposase
MDKLSQFIQDNPDPRELKRALAVQIVRQDYRHREIQQILQVSSGFISKWTQAHEQQGLEGLRLRYKGSVGYLDAEQRQAVLAWLEQKSYWDLQELQAHLDEHYGVAFQSNQSYYELFHAAGISWKKTQKRNPKKDPELLTLPRLEARGNLAVV